ncbi:MAG: cytochrome b/b6 domain-containing protein [Chloroflexi bacterium]|nr:cytochrome b/b6 domain-containing protein [Chloroflexota bacterium]MBI3167621.1 cytochrome b/b6 domain-containing protein [Chloroflexota bacterium]
MTTIATTKPQPSAAHAFTRYLLPFMVSFAIALVSGLFYYLVPHDWNWAASQAALWIHLISGIIGIFYLVPYVLAHYKEKDEDPLNLIFPWRAFRRRGNESDWSYQQRIYGHTLNWLMALLSISGLVIALPGVLWLGGVVWLPGYTATQAGNLIHLGLALIALAFIGFHIARKRKRQTQR